jgi:hypothetical protein
VVFFVVRFTAPALFLVVFLVALPVSFAASFVSDPAFFMSCLAPVFWDTAIPARAIMKSNEINNLWMNFMRSFPVSVNPISK